MTFYAVKKTDGAFTTYFDDSIALTPEDAYYRFTDQEPISGRDVNELLLEQFGTVFGEQAVTVQRLTPIKSVCEKCGADIRQSDSITIINIYSPDNDFMGSVYCDTLNAGIRLALKISEGHCPICEEWEDGAGNICSRNGFGRTEHMFLDMHRVDRIDASRFVAPRPEYNDASFLAGDLPDNWFELLLEESKLKKHDK